MTDEFAFIERVRNEAARRASPDGAPVIGIGDDAAVWRTRDGFENVITVDLLVEDIDFRRDYAVARLLGHKALVVSLSDIAAMGARPRYSLLTLAIPGGFDDGFWSEFFDGYFALAARCGVTLIGGDISTSPDRFAIDSIVIGECMRGRAVRRAGAQPGDAVYVTGAIGASAAGLELLKNGARAGQAGNDLVQSALMAHLRPEPRTEFGARVGELQLAHAMIDISDGLGRDLAHICEASGASAVIDFDAVPIAGEVGLICEDREFAFAFAAGGGEDFELLVAADGGREPELMDAASACGAPITRIGEIIEARDSRLYLRRDGKQTPMIARGYEHSGI
ncbi:MAG: thiamine-phosphate kinase [Acidobacteria bacterium]|nr:thiamine-phosphate kinase [Acidobacteriota bacterium]